MRLESRNYLEQRDRWPRSGRHILAQFDDDSVVVYQAYRPSIGRFAAEHGHFGGDFSLDRMSWVKPNFLWMMHRSGWATEPDQEVVLAVRLVRSAFDELLAAAVHSSFVAEVYDSHESWKEHVRGSDVRLQWDPDHDASGARQERRAIQLGIRGNTLRRYAREWIVDIEDVTAFVAEQRDNIGELSRLLTPREDVYPVTDPGTRERLGLSEWPGR